MFQTDDSKCENNLRHQKSPSFLLRKAACIFFRFIVFEESLVDGFISTPEPTLSTYYIFAIVFFPIKYLNLDNHMIQSRMLLIIEMPVSSAINKRRQLLFNFYILLIQIVMIIYACNQITVLVHFYLWKYILTNLSIFSYF